MAPTPTPTPVSSSYIKRKNLDFPKMIARLNDLQTKYTAAQVFSLAGFTPAQVSYHELENACTVRLSIALNECGDPIPPGYGFRPQRQNLISSVYAMSKYLTRKYEEPDIKWSVSAGEKMTSRVGKSQGIVLIMHPSGIPGASHATAWEAGSVETIDGRDRTDTSFVQFWKF